jgi:hypothetical protein
MSYAVPPDANILSASSAEINFFIKLKIRPYLIPSFEAVTDKISPDVILFIALLWASKRNGHF